MLVWNEDLEGEVIQVAFAFATKHLQDHDYVIAFHSWSANAKNNIARVYKTYWMLVKKEWMGMNCMHLTSVVDNTKMVHLLHFFKILSPFVSGFFGYSCQFFWDACKYKSLESPLWSRTLA